MNAKSLLIPVAAFAVTVTGVQAFNSQVLENAGLDPEKIAAFETAHELKREGDKDGARDVLVEAGIDLDTMKTIRKAMHEHRHEMKSVLKEALEAGDYEAFKEAIEGSSLSDIVTSEADFELFKEAYDLRENGEPGAAKIIMEELGFEGRPHMGMGMGHHHHHHHDEDDHDED